MNIDFKLLAKQKQTLIQLSNEFEANSDFNKSEDLDGVINLLDALEDQHQGKDETTEAAQPKNKTYFMFYGSDVKFLLSEEIELTEENSSDFTLFTFIEGETRPHDLLNSVLGWGEYSEITEEEFVKYSNL